MAGERRRGACPRGAMFGHCTRARDIFLRSLHTPGSGKSYVLRHLHSSPVIDENNVGVYANVAGLAPDGTR